MKFKNRYKVQEILCTGNKLMILIHHRRRRTLHHCQYQKYRLQLICYIISVNKRINTYIPYFSAYKMHSPQIWEENGGMSYGLNVTYLARWGWRGQGWRGFFFFPIFLF